MDKSLQTKWYNEKVQWLDESNMYRKSKEKFIETMKLFIDHDIPLSILSDVDTVNMIRVLDAQLKFFLKFKFDIEDIINRLDAIKCVPNISLNNTTRISFYRYILSDENDYVVSRIINEIKSSSEEFEYTDLTGCYDKHICHLYCKLYEVIIPEPECKTSFVKLIDDLKQMGYCDLQDTDIHDVTYEKLNMYHFVWRTNRNFRIDKLHEPFKNVGARTIKRISSMISNEKYPINYDVINLMFTKSMFSNSMERLYDSYKIIYLSNYFKMEEFDNVLNIIKIDDEPCDLLCKLFYNYVLCCKCNHGRKITLDFITSSIDAIESESYKYIFAAMFNYEDIFYDDITEPANIIITYVKNAMDKCENVARRIDHDFVFCPELVKYCSSILEKIDDIRYQGVIDRREEKHKQLIQKKEEKKSEYEEIAVAVITQFLDPEFKTKKEFIRKHSIDEKDFDKYKEVVKERHPDLYKKYESKINDILKQRYAIIISQAQQVMDKIKENKDFTLFDYHMICAKEVKDLYEFVSTGIAAQCFKREDVNALYRFYKRNMGKMYYFNFSEEFNSTSKWMIGTYEITNAEKHKIINFMNAKGWPYYRYLYKELGRRYVKGEINL